MAWVALAVVFAAGLFRFFDVWTYLAAGERLNAGHSLYMLAAGDRPVALDPPYYSVPLVSPPLVAVVWRPLAALPFGLGVATWYLATTAAVLYSLAAIFRVAPAVACLIAPSAGVLAGSGNLHAFILLVGVLVWRYREAGWAGLALGIVTVAKLVSAPLAATFVATQNKKGLMALVWACALSLLVGVAGAGWAAHVAYLGAAQHFAPQPASLSYLTGIGWLSPALFALSSFVACWLRPAAAYQLGVLATSLFVPGLGFAAVCLLGLLVLPRQGAPRSTVRSYGGLLGLIGVVGAVTLKYLVVV